MFNASDHLRKFCQIQGIPIDIYREISSCLISNGEKSNVCPPHRYFTRNPFVSDNNDEITEISGYPVRAVGWIPGFYCVDGRAPISSSELYRKRKILCLDITSALAVRALDVAKADNVLDLCCAPGGKLILIAGSLDYDKSAVFFRSGSVTGVDISRPRLANCRAIVKKNRASPLVRLFLDDGTAFNRGPPAAYEPGKSLATDAFYSPRRMRYLPSSFEFYDKVIVDAECTHDGSIVHLLKQMNADSFQKWIEEYLNENALSRVETLQRSLLENGFSNLKVGGILVYSTCSLSMRQNEDIVTWFLGKYPNAVMEDIQSLFDIPKAADNVYDMFETVMSERASDCGSSHFAEVKAKSCRFFGTFITSGEEKWWTSGFFIAKFRKRS